MATEYQIKELERKLSLIQPDKITGKFSAQYHALFNKIKNLKIELAKNSQDKRWNDFLAQ